MATTYYCLGCNQQIDEPVCSICGDAAEPLDDVDPITGDSRKSEPEKYPETELKALTGEESLDNLNEDEY